MKKTVVVAKSLIFRASPTYNNIPTESIYKICIIIIHSYNHHSIITLLLLLLSRYVVVVVVWGKSPYFSRLSAYNSRTTKIFPVVVPPETLKQAYICDMKMFLVDVRKAQEQFRELEKQLSSHKVASAQRMALNDSIRIGRTHVKRSVSKIYNFTSSVLNDTTTEKGLKIRLATNSNLETKITAGHTPRTMYSFKGTKVFRKEVSRSISVVSNINTRKTKVLRGERNYADGGIMVEVYRGKKKVIPSAFPLFVGKGIKGAFSKTLQSSDKMVPFGRGDHNGARFNWGKKRKPIAPLKGISLATAVMNTKAQDKYAPIIQQKYIERYNHQLSRLIRELRNT